MPAVRMLTTPVPAIPELALIGTADFQAAHTGLSPHEHGECMEIVIFDRGRHRYTAGGVDFSMTGGDFFLTPPRCVHSSGGHPQDKARHAWMQIDLTRRRKPHTFMDQPRGETLRRRLRALPVLQGRAPAGSYRQLVDWTNLLEHTAHPLPDLVELQIRSRLTHLLINLVVAATSAPATPATPATTAATTAPSAAPGPAAAPLIAAALAHMQTHIAMPLSVPSIARACGYSPSAFKQAFRKSTGMSPADYFLRLRIDEAKRRLTTGQQSVTAVAHDLGFSSGQYFATVFRRLTTLTPGAWRLRQRV